MNKKKLLVSLGLVTLVVAAVVGGTTAFFSDTETSEGNTFTAGEIDLKVDSEAHYAGLVCVDGYWVEEGQETTRPDLVGVPCGGTWELTDLGSEYTFFNYGDLKPGDHGENTISLHVTSNPAYMCAIVDNMVDLDNGQTEPELEDGDDDSVVGELSRELHFFAWEDDGDNVWEDGEMPLFSNEEGPASDVLDGRVYPMYTPDNGPFMPNETKYIGMYWCYGDVEVEEYELSCSGEEVTNLTQTDSLTADITFYVEQARNNPDFECPPVKELTFVRVSPDGGNESNKVTQYNGYYLPHVDYTIDGDCIDFTFINPTPFQFAFDYRVDGEAGTNGPWYDVIIHEGLLNGQAIGEEYNLVTLGGYSSQLVHVCGQDEIQVGLRQGAEQNWYFDWIVFDAQEI